MRSLFSFSNKESFVSTERMTRIKLEVDFNQEFSHYAKLEKGVKLVDDFFLANKLSSVFTN